jgi:hypothetical protein
LGNDYNEKSITAPESRDCENFSTGTTVPEKTRDPGIGSPKADVRLISIVLVLSKGIEICVISSLNILSLVVFCYVFSLVSEDFTVYGYCFDKYYEDYE